MLPVKKIQNWMKENNKDIFLINRTDEFLNEYIAPYAERLCWISNFSGSAGRAIIERNRAYIFIDGRYTEQAKNQVDPIFFEIKHLKDYWKHLEMYKKENKIIFLDPILHSITEVEKIKKLYNKSKVLLNFLKINPVDLLWNERPKFPKSKAFIHDLKYAGEDQLVKIKKIQEKLRLNLIDLYLLSSLDSIAWILNIRGNDIQNTPLLFCYAIISVDGKIELFIDRSKIINIEKKLKHFVKINPIKSMDAYLTSISKEKILGFDEDCTSYYFKYLSYNQKVQTKNLENPCLYLKAKKNKIELNGAKKSNLRDGVSITKYLYWLKNKMKVDITNEINAANYLLNLRKDNELYYSLSFDTISAFGMHSALPHYRVSKESNLPFTNNSIYLVDSGAQYLDGTTDITRTITIGSPTNEQKDRFTRVLKGHIGIAEATFRVGTRGSQLDPIARKSLQEINCDYDHGTGHGIGSFLSVHEGPQKIAKSQNKNDGIILEGMIISNEPGYYKKGEYGIRTENLLICRAKNDKLLYFETISFAPIDIDLIEISLLNDYEIKWINNYHKQVYEKISPKLRIEETNWLKEVTKSLKKKIALTYI